LFTELIDEAGIEGNGIGCAGSRCRKVLLEEKKSNLILCQRSDALFAKKTVLAFLMEVNP